MFFCFSLHEFRLAKFRILGVAWTLRRVIHLRSRADPRLRHIWLIVGFVSRGKFSQFRGEVFKVVLAENFLPYCLQSWIFSFAVVNFPSKMKTHFSLLAKWMNLIHIYFLLFMSARILKLSSKKFEDISHTLSSCFIKDIIRAWHLNKIIWLSTA